MFMGRTSFLYFKQITMSPFNVPGLIHLSFQGGDTDSFITFKQIQHHQSPFITLSSSINAQKSAEFVI